MFKHIISSYNYVANTQFSNLEVIDLGFAEVGFGRDDMMRPKVLSKVESFKQIMNNIFLCRPGNFPSYPELGLDIGSRIDYVDPDDIDFVQLKEDIRGQMVTVFNLEEIGDIVAFSLPHPDGNGNVVVISVPLLIDTDEGADRLLAMFSKDEKTGELLSSIKAQLGEKLI